MEFKDIGDHDTLITWVEYRGKESGYLIITSILRIIVILVTVH